MKYIGAHIDLKPLSAIPEAAHALGAGAFSFCPIDARRYSDAPYTDEEVASFRSNCELFGFSSDRILPHASLTANPCSPDRRKLNLSRISLIDQFQRCRSLGLSMLNFHPGATLKEMSEPEAIALVAATVNHVLDRTSDVCAVIENTAGQGSNIGYNFAQLAEIIDKVDDKSRVGVCIDTCHANAAGYDLSTKEAFDATWKEFDNTIGFRYRKGMQLNDSMRPTGSRIDRHAPIGQGTIGNDFFKLLMSDNRFCNIPMILETPDPSLWEIEIGWLRANSAP